MKIAVQSARIFERAGTEGGFKLLHDVGFEGVDFGISRWFHELSTLSPEYLFLPINTAKIHAKADTYKRAAEDNEIFFTQTHALFPIWKEGDAEYNERAMEKLHSTIELTAYLGSPYCIVHPAFRPMNADRMSADEEWDLNRSMYEALIPTLKQYNVVCCLENLFSSGPEGMRYASVCSDFHDAAKWVDDLNAAAGQELFGFCFDTGHCNIVNQNQRRALNILGKRLKTLHIHDNDGSTDCHIAPYMGTIDWEGFMNGLKDIGYQGDLAFETFLALDRYPEAMTADVLNIIARTGQYFRKRLEE